MKKMFWQLFVAHTTVMALTLLLYGAFSAGREVNPVGVVLLAILAGTVTGTFVTFLMRKKLGPISAFARKIASGDFRNRLIADDRDETAELSDSLNAMAEALEQKTASLHDEKVKMEKALLGMTGVKVDVDRANISGIAKDLKLLRSRERISVPTWLIVMPDGNVVDERKGFYDGSRAALQ